MKTSKTINTVNKTLIALVAGAVLTTGANAAVSYNNNAMGQAYVGVKAGQFDVDAKATDTDNPTAYGVYAGYDFGQGFGGEVEYLASTDADFTDTDDATTGEFSMQTLGAYGTYKYNLPNSGLYAKGKLGYAQTTVEADGGDELDDTGFAGGVGLGLNLTSHLSVEGEYTMLPSVDKDVDANLMSIGAHFKF